MAVSEYHWKFLVTVTKMYSDGHYISPTDTTTISPGFFTVYGIILLLSLKNEIFQY